MLLRMLPLWPSLRASLCLRTVHTRGRCRSSCSGICCAMLNVRGSSKPLWCRNKPGMWQRCASVLWRRGMDSFAANGLTQDSAAIFTPLPAAEAPGRRGREAPKLCAIAVLVGTMGRGHASVLVKPTVTLRSCPLADTDAGRTPCT